MGVEAAEDPKQRGCQAGIMYSSLRDSKSGMRSGSVAWAQNSLWLGPRVPLRCDPARRRLGTSDPPRVFLPPASARAALPRQGAYSGCQRGSPVPITQRKAGCRGISQATPAEGAPARLPFRHPMSVLCGLAGSFLVLSFVCSQTGSFQTGLGHAVVAHRR